MIRYRVSFDRPGTHHVDVTLSIDAAPAELSLWLPVWTPGSYLVREFAKNLRDVRAEDAGGNPLAVTRVDKATFRVDAPANSVVTVRYRVYAFERSVRTSYVDANGGLLNGASVFLAVDGREHEPHEVTLALPSGWHALTALDTAGAEVFRAADFARLVDAPILVGAPGQLREFPFQVDGVPHVLAILGDGNYDGPALADATRRIVQVNARAFGGLPYRRYLFLTVAAPEGRGGLEHADSSVLQHPRFEFRDETPLIDFHSLVAHEHLHVWNVKRFRPADFHPYDLKRETYTRLLWLVEGVTAYLDELIPLRAGLVTRDRYWKRLGDEITRLHETPSRRAETLEEASLLAWVRLYRPDEDTPNSGVNYYQQGSLAGLVLDLEIRVASAGRHGVDDLLKALDARFGDGRSGYTGKDVEAVAQDLAGRDLSDLFRRLYRTTEEIDLAGALAKVGMKLELGSRKNGSASAALRDLLGIRVDPGGARLVIDTVERGSAAEAAGLSPKDEIIAIDGWRVRVADLGKRLAERAGVRAARLSVFRDDHLVEIEVRVSPPAAHVVTLVEDPRASVEVRRLRDAWLGDSVAVAAQPAAPGPPADRERR